MKLVPISDNVVVKREEKEGKTKGGILLPDTAQMKMTRGEVLAVGPGNFHPKSGLFVPMEVKKGDVIVFNAYGGTEVTIEGEEVVVLSQVHILGKLV